MRLCIDWDGVIHNPQNVTKGHRMGNPIEGAVEAMKLLRDAGHTLIVFTARGPKQYIREWLRFFEIPFDSVTNVKPDDVAFFVDDHALRFRGNWDETLDEMSTLDDKYKEERENTFF
jgi:hypothetical protein